MRKGEPSGGMGKRWHQPTAFRAKGKPVIPTPERSPEGEDHYVVATLVRLARPSSHPRFPLTRSSQDRWWNAEEETTSTEEPPILNLGTFKPVAVLSIRRDCRAGPSTILNCFASEKRSKTNQRRQRPPETSQLLTKTARRELARRSRSIQQRHHHQHPKSGRGGRAAASFSQSVSQSVS
jgi:hypothetical protein